MKKFKMLMFLLFSALNISKCYCEAYNLPIQPQFQPQNTEWCWAFTSAMVLKWYSVLVDVDMVKKYGSNIVDKPIPLYGSCEISGDHSIQQILDHFAAIKMKGQTTVPDYATVLIPLIKDKRPIIARWKYNDGSAHFVLITGYNSDLKNVKFIDPLIGAATLPYDEFCRDDFHIWSHTGIIETLFSVNYSLGPTNYNDESTFNGYSTLGGAIAQNGSCTPFTITGPCALVQSVNVHDNSTKLWFGNIKGAYSQFPLYFSKKGNYKLKIKFRGSVFKVKQSATSGDNCFFSSSWPYFANVMTDINTFANLSIVSPSANKIGGNASVIITGKDLNGPVCNAETANSAAQQNLLSCKCRVYTKNEKAELSDVELTYAVTVYQPGTTYFKATIADNNYNAILGLSIHEINTEFVSEFCGCMDPQANNFDVNASVSTGTCTYNPPIPGYTFSSIIGDCPYTVQFQGKNTGGPLLNNSWSWNFADGGTANIQNPTHEFTKSGNYLIKLTLAGKNGGVYSINNAYVKVKEPAPLISITATSIQGVRPLTVQLTGVNIGGTVNANGWNWAISDGSILTGQNVQYTFNKAGKYTVTLIATGPDYTVEKSIMITVIPNLIPIINMLLE